MKKKIKRILALAIAFLLLVVFCGCTAEAYLEKNFSEEYIKYNPQLKLKAAQADFEKFTEIYKERSGIKKKFRFMYSETTAYEHYYECLRAEETLSLSEPEIFFDVAAMSFDSAVIKKENDRVRSFDKFLDKYKPIFSVFCEFYVEIDDALYSLYLIYNQEKNEIIYVYEYFYGGTWVDERQDAHASVYSIKEDKKDALFSYIKSAYEKVREALPESDKAKD